MALYNQFSTMPYIPYRILEYLAQNNEVIWKLLKYQTVDALSKPNLTLSEKLDLIWNGDSDQENYSVFFQRLVENAMLDSKTILKIYKVNIKPVDHIKADVSYEFDIMYGSKLAEMRYNGILCNRGDVFETEMLKTINGAYVGGIGTLQFNKRKSNYDESNYNLGDSKSFDGISFIMTTQLGDVKNE